MDELVREITWWGAPSQEGKKEMNEFFSNMIPHDTTESLMIISYKTPLYKTDHYM